jgi:hypothetical protein
MEMFRNSGMYFGGLFTDTENVMATKYEIAMKRKAAW